ncbi:MAG TPA: hypothetical protein VGM88_02130 [Kofleriaceae bacterium]|jgi:hypothetical protein
MKTLCLLVLLGAAACGDDGNAQKDAPVVTPDANVADAPPDADCFSGTPATHEEIINACTTDQYYDKDSHPPLLNADGSLPPLP